MLKGILIVNYYLLVVPIHTKYIIIQPSTTVTCTTAIPVLVEIPKVLLTGWWTSEIYPSTTHQVDGRPHPDGQCAALEIHGNHT